MAKGGYHPDSRAQGLCEEGVVHERTLTGFRVQDERCDALARWAFGALRQVCASRPELLAAIDTKERAYWAADSAEDGYVERHITEGVELFAQLGELMLQPQPGRPVALAEAA